jgi:hypothetical protein
MSCCRYGGAQMGFGSYVVCMERSGIRDDQCHEAPTCYLASNRSFTFFGSFIFLFNHFNA